MIRALDEMCNGLSAKRAISQSFNHPLQYMLDSYPCRTSNGDEAAAFYVPIYTALLGYNRTRHCEMKTCPKIPALQLLGRQLGAHLNKKPYLQR
jgi:hypothetical protein